jgi:dihydroneopterin aldolase/2-amino-4-hydroxy-6-hydroxymethyldihydropteridine diphosphokinase/dihydropteroate synthase/2-amino-4-hydroxy-6-hydroxymethyldihydropteridine diphosphokinase/dihydropteroate synthase
MYVTNQPPFLNAVAEVRTRYEPRELLQELKAIEQDLGRTTSTQRFGPRPIDLDIVLYGDRRVDLPNNLLTIPHPRLREREFVLRPLCDIDYDIVIPDASSTAGANATITGQSARQLLRAVRREVMNGGNTASPSGMVRVSPLTQAVPAVLRWDARPKLMGIVNVTPDSFSDGGQFQLLDKAMKLVEEYHEHGFHIVDVSSNFAEHTASKQARRTYSDWGVCIGGEGGRAEHAPWSVVRGRGCRNI